MIQGKGKVIFKLFLAVVILMSFLVSWTKPASSAGVTCTWLGGTSGSWHAPSNWDCGHIPVVEDTVIIPTGVSFYPVFDFTDWTKVFRVDKIYIYKDAMLTITNTDGGERNFDANEWHIDGMLKFSSSAYSFSVNLNYSVPTGTINVGIYGDIFFDVSVGALRFYSPYNNNGELRQRVGGECAVLLKAGGTHGGVFNIKNIMIQATDPNSEFIFVPGSQLNVPDLNPYGGKVYIRGGYNAAGDTTGLIIDGGYVEIDSAAAVTMPYLTSIGSGTTLTIKSPLSMRFLGLSGTLDNLSTISVNTGLNWTNGGFTGVGTTTIESGTTSTITSTGGGTIDTQTLTLAGTTNWNGKNVTLSNGAAIINNGTFNANATTTMTGGTTESFTNNGSFFKKVDGTTTTMDILFNNAGTVQVVAGSLVFLQGIENGEDVVIDLGGGTLDPGDELTLESGDSLVGSGTLAADLVNGGTVSPGESPGIITVQGYYTQLETGVLEIQLGGEGLGMGYDQLEVKGVASLAGTLNVRLINEFEPESYMIFNIMLYASKTGTFSTVNLPPGYDWTLTYDDKFLKISGEPVDSYEIYLPLILK